MIARVMDGHVAREQEADAGLGRESVMRELGRAGAEDDVGGELDVERRARR